MHLLISVSPLAPTASAGFHFLINICCCIQTPSWAAPTISQQPRTTSATPLGPLHASVCLGQLWSPQPPLQTHARTCLLNACTATSRTSNMRCTPSVQCTLSPQTLRIMKLWLFNIAGNSNSTHLPSDMNIQPGDYEFYPSPPQTQTEFCHYPFYNNLASLQNLHLIFFALPSSHYSSFQLLSLP